MIRAYLKLKVVLLTSLKPFDQTAVWHDILIYYEGSSVALICTSLFPHIYLYLYLPFHKKISTFKQNSSYAFVIKKEVSREAVGGDLTACGKVILDVVLQTEIAIKLQVRMHLRDFLLFFASTLFLLEDVQAMASSTACLRFFQFYFVNNDASTYFLFFEEKK